MASHSDVYRSGDQVRAERFGVGFVEFDKGETVIVRFEHGLEECVKSRLTKLSTPLQAIHDTQWHTPLEVITRVQAEAIQSVNDAWGVLSRSRIALLPHQLWVCKRVLEYWPTRWLIADDVGLGKTIEAGLVLWPVISKHLVRRLLVLCPAKLVDQWQYRLRTMFDIKLARYLTEADTQNADFFSTHDQVVASFHTLALWLSDKESTRGKKTDRLSRFLASPSWDLVIVDEAHHFNYDEQGGPTLGFRLIKTMQEHRRIEAMLFFTGTPHRGKNFGFMQLIGLLRPDLFAGKKTLQDCLPLLSKVMIRNNKHNVTDLTGKTLFKKPRVQSKQYTYSPAEAKFYHLLTVFIASGRAYASTLASREGRAVQLVLIAMQKLASSSVAAIRRAIQGRLGRTAQTRKQLEDRQRRLSELSAQLDGYAELAADPSTMDELSKLEEEVAELAADLRLMEDEEPRLHELLLAADAVIRETKIDRLMEEISLSFSGQQVLLFTEYKATQSTVMSALIREYGDGCVTFINGDERAEGIIDAAGNSRTLEVRREEAAKMFNDGIVRFLVSTEAGGEGIDLQERCHALIHVDLPWNPMRLHQRVGRLNRYGQKEVVSVLMFHNPDTVESLIWQKLDGKTQQIMRSLSHVMEEPEDLMELVLGMTNPALFNELYADAGRVPPESLSKWFDEKTAQFGGKDVLDTVRDLVGHCDKFDFQRISAQIPRVDLPDLRSFLLSMLHLNRRRVHEVDGLLSFKTPDEWRTEPGVRSNYEGMTFDRDYRGFDAAQKILGVGHKAFDHAVLQGKACRSCVTVMGPGTLKERLVVFRVGDRVTQDAGPVRAAIVGVSQTEDGKTEIVRDWELLLKLNGMAESRGIRTAAAGIQPEKPDSIIAHVDGALQELRSKLSELNFPFRVPEIQPLAIFWPATLSGDAPDEGDDT